MAWFVVASVFVEESCFLFCYVHGCRATRVKVESAEGCACALVSAVSEPLLSLPCTVPFCSVSVAGEKRGVGPVGVVILRSSRI